MQIILSTAYFPPIQYLSKFIISKDILIETCESYSKQSYRNRCEILTANGVQTLSVPVKKNESIHIRDILIDYSDDWQRNHTRAIMSAYKNSAFFEFFEEDINTIILSNQKYLIDLNMMTLDFLLKAVGIESDYELTKQYDKDGLFLDYRDSIHPKKRMQKKDNEFVSKKYNQVFADRFDFVPNLSSLDLLCNMGRETVDVLRK